MEGIPMHHLGKGEYSSIPYLGGIVAQELEGDLVLDTGLVIT